GSVADKTVRAPDTIRLGLFRYYNKDQPQVHYPGNLNPVHRTHLLDSYIRTFNFALLDGRRVTPTSRSVRNSAGSSIIQAKIGTMRCAGEIRSIFIHEQTGIPESRQTVLAAVEWMKTSPFTPLENPKFIWDDYPELGIETWEIDRYQDRQDGAFPIVLPLGEIHCQLARGRIEHTDPKMWITATMDR
ncbi:hypothetical protein B0H16DRAFT_1775042, partial [Mycena metata]